MKNIMLGIVSVFVIVYTLLLGLNVLYVQTQKNQLERHVSRIVQNTLEREFQKGEDEVVKQMLQQEIVSTISGDEKVLHVEIQEIDLEKGLLSVKVTKHVEMLNGRKKTIVVEKTAIMERDTVFHNFSVGR